MTTNRDDILDHWSDFKSYLPGGFDLEATARSRGALMRAREVKSAEALLRLALAYGGCGMSLRETCAWAEAAGIARLADPSLLERLVKAAPWLGDIVAALIAAQAQLPTGRWLGYRLRALDATTICEPGADQTTWRLHVGYALAAGQVDELELTDVHGAENLQRLTYTPGDIALSDRCYARPRDLRPVIEAGADFIARTGWNSLRLMQEDGRPFDLFAALTAQAAQEGEVAVRVHEGAADDAPGLLVRLVIRRKDPEHAQAEQKRLLKQAKKRGKKPDPRSLEAAKYILLLTSLPIAIFSTAAVLALYRFRWQIELAFKRMKSLAGLGALPAKNPGLAQAWIYARLIVALVAEQIAGKVPDSPPCGHGKTGRQSNPKRPSRHHKGQSVPLAPHQNGARQHPCRHPRTVVVANRQERFRPHLSPPMRAATPT